MQLNGITLKKPLFQKRRWSCHFPPRKTPVAQKHRAISRQKKMAFSTPVGLSWDSPPPPTESVRTDGRTEVRTDGHVTITSQPKFLGLIGYQISLAMELRYKTVWSKSFYGLLIITIFILLILLFCLFSGVVYSKRNKTNYDFVKFKQASKFTSPSKDLIMEMNNE